MKKAKRVRFFIFSQLSILSAKKITRPIQIQKTKEKLNALRTVRTTAAKVKEMKAIILFFKLMSVKTSPPKERFLQ